MKFSMTGLKKISWVGALALLLCSCQTESLDRSDVALTKPQAQKALMRTLPVSAKNIYYLFYAGGMQDLESFLRFEVDEGQLDTAVTELIADNDKRMHRSNTYTRKTLAMAPQCNPRVEFLPMTWWTPSAIHRGYYMGNEQNEAFALQIWVDEDASCIFVYQND